MATTRSTPVRKAWRALIWLFVIIAVLFGIQGAGAIWAGWGWAPKLALDLEGGTALTLTPQLAEGQSVTQEQLDQAVAIIRQRVDSAGVAEAEIATLGVGTEQKIIVNLPGEPDAETLSRIQQSAKLEFRAVLAIGVTNPTASTNPDDAAVGEGAEGPEDAVADEVGEEPGAETTPQPTPTDGSDLNWITPELEEQFLNFDCGAIDTAATGVAPVDEPLITCYVDGYTTFLLGPVEVSGEMIQDATAGVVAGQGGFSTNQWAVNIVFNGEGTEKFADVTSRLIQFWTPDASNVRNQFAILLDGYVISAPTTQAAITDGKPQITGNFTQETAQILADQLKHGALPIGFQLESQETIDATLGESQLQAGILAGIVGLILVAIYSFFQYRVLSAVTMASLVVAGVLTYSVITIMAWHYGYRLSLAGVAGLIIAIGLTADSFIVYFERIRDELRDGKTLVGAVEAGWARALRTILAAKGVNLLSALVLFFLAVGSVRGFAFTLGITVIIDVLVVVLFTHPMLQLLATTRFYSSGHPLSGLDPKALGAVYRGRAEFRISKEARRSGASREAHKRQTIAERKAAESELASVGAREGKDS